MVTSNVHRRPPALDLLDVRHRPILQCPQGIGERVASRVSLCSTRGVYTGLAEGSLL
jgi:hypothetical protein